LPKGKKSAKKALKKPAKKPAKTEEKDVKTVAFGDRRR